MEKAHVTPKDFFLWAGAMAAFYFGISMLVATIFTLIDALLPDVLFHSVDAYSDGLRFQIASLIVSAPLYLVLVRIIRRDITNDPSRNEIWVRRWALMFTLFVAGATIAIDLITLVNTFLGGELTIRFALKVAIVLLMATGVFLHFLADMWGYWSKYPQRAISVSIAVATLVIGVIASSFVVIGSPSQLRSYRFDDQKVYDLTSIQSQVVEYWRQKEALPKTLADLNDSISGYIAPVDPQNGTAYEYMQITGRSFHLCATFNLETRSDSPTLNNIRATSAYSIPMEEKGASWHQDNWYHPGGRVCFERTIDPTRYPPYPKAAEQKLK